MIAQSGIQFGNSRGIVLMRRDGEITHFGVRFYRRRIRAFNNFITREWKRDVLNQKVKSLIAPLFMSALPSQLVYCGNFAESRVGLFLAVIDGYFVTELMADIAAERPFLCVGEQVFFDPKEEMEGEGVKIYPIEKMVTVSKTSFCQFFKELVNQYRTIF